MPELAEAVETPEVADAAVDDSAHNSPAVGDNGATDDGGAEASSAAVETGSTGEPTETQDAGVAQEESQDGRVLPAALKKHLAELKGTNPQLSKELRDLWFANRALKEEFPGGLQEIRQLRESVQEFGGIEGIKELKQANDVWNDIDEQWIQGDPTFADRLAEANPQSFSAIAPRFIDNYSRVDPEGYQRVFGRILAATLRDAEIGNALYLAKQNLALKNTEEAGRLLGEVEQWIGGINELAKQAPKAPAKAPELDRREQSLNEREQKLFRESVAREFRSSVGSSIQSEIKQVLKGKALDQDRMGVFTRLVDEEIAKLVDGDKSIKQTIERYEAAGDSQGVIKFVNSRVKPLVPKAVDKVYKLLFANTAAKTATAKVPAKAPAKVEQGWVKIQGPPRPEDVDHSKTPFEMKFKNQAVLKNGKKVTW
jgi:hypothetical protein